MRLYNDKYTIVTGGAGFIGSCLVRELNDRGIDKVVIVDELGSDERWQNLLKKKYLQYLHKTELFDWLQGRESEIESIFHLGACSSTVEKDADFLMKNNYQYTRTLVEYALKNELKICIASSAATYGDGSNSFSDDHAKLATLKPLNIYGFSKHAVDLWLLQEGLLNQVTSVKYFNVFGPNEWHKGRMASRIMSMVQEAQEKGYIQLFESHHPDYQHGEQKRDFIYVKDAVRITQDLVELERHGVYNVGSGIASTWNELARAVFQSLLLPVDIRYIPMPEDLKGKYQYYTKAEVEKLKKLFNGKNPCLYTLFDAVDDYIHKHILTSERW